MPVPGLIVVGATLLCGMLGGCVTTEGTAPGQADSTERVASGKRTFLQKTFMTMDERCRPVPRPKGVLTEPPRHGKVRLATRKAAAEYGPGPMRHCDGKVGPSLAFEYASKRGYRGPDSFLVRIRYNDGEIRHERFEIAVD
ncbi:hypothetical protein [Bosea beijingensis]|jgi:hypothetical protein